MSNKNKTISTNSVRTTPQGVEPLGTNLEGFECKYTPGTSGYKIDWLSLVYYKNAENGFSITNLMNDLGYDMGEFKVTPGRNFYQKGYTLGDYVNIYYDHHSNDSVNIVFTGQGCTDLYNRLVDTKDGFLGTLKNVLEKYSLECKRLDIAFDDFNGIFDLELIETKLKNGEFKSIKRTYGVIESRNTDSSIESKTIYLGNHRNSPNNYIRIYDKKAQYENKNNILPGIVQKTNIWNRLEISFKKHHARQVFDDLLINGVSIDDIFKSNLKKNITFLDPTESQKNAKYPRKENWDISDWWLDFVGGVNSYDLIPHERDTDLYRAMSWFRNTCLPSLKVFETIFSKQKIDIYSEIKSISVEPFIYNLSKKQVRLINDSEKIDKHALSDLLELFKINRL